MDWKRYRGISDDHNFYKDPGEGFKNFLYIYTQMTPFTDERVENEKT
jgi:hypothetical protein